MRNYFIFVAWISKANNWLSLSTVPQGFIHIVIVLWQLNLVLPVILKLVKQLSNCIFNTINFSWLSCCSDFLWKEISNSSCSTKSWSNITVVTNLLSYTAQIFLWLFFSAFLGSLFGVFQDVCSCLLCPSFLLWATIHHLFLQHSLPLFSVSQYASAHLSFYLQLIVCFQLCRS